MPDLTAKEHAFINSYLAQGPNVVGSKAAIEAGYSESGASVTANRLLKRAHVAAEIARRRAPIEKKSQLTAEKLYAALSNLVDLDPAACYDESGKLLPINKMPLEVRKALTGIDGEKLKFSSRLGAIELSAKLLGLVKEQQVQQQAVQITIAAPPALPDVSVSSSKLLPEWE